MVLCKTLQVGGTASDPGGSPVLIALWQRKRLETLHLGEGRGKSSLVVETIDEVPAYDVPQLVVPLDRLRPLTPSEFPLPGRKGTQHSPQGAVSVPSRVKHHLHGSVEPAVAAQVVGRALGRPTHDVQ